MDLDNVKQTDIAGWLEAQGFSPTRTRGSKLWYCSPLRDEKTASFKVDTARNSWYDFGLSKGGNIIDLVMAKDNLSFPQALRVLEGCASFPPRPNRSSSSDPTIEHVREQPLTNQVLLSYLRERMISPETAQAECVEVSYNIGKASYYAVGFKNEADGYSVRNKFYKGCVGPQAISVRNSAGCVCYIFEGFIDYLSYREVLRLRDQPTDHCQIILNSCSNAVKAVKHIRQHPNIKKVILLLDRDEAGRRASSSISEQMEKTVEVSDGSSFLDPYNDVNDWWQHCFR